MFRGRVLGGLSVSENCAFTTITYRQGEGRQRDALSVQADWKELWRRLRRKESWKDVKWLKVVELTKKKQPHIHTVMTNIEKPMVCSMAKGKDSHLKSKKLVPNCKCALHQLTAAWWSITGDSYQIDMREVYSPKEDSYYLAKYMAKNELIRGELETLGFSRRFSQSHGWPGGKRLRLYGTAKELWKDRRFEYGRYPESDYWGAETSSPLLTKVGDPVAVQRAEKLEKLKATKKLMKSLGVQPIA